MQGKYDNYLNAINETDFGKMNALIASMNDAEASIINSLEVNAEWESQVKNTLIAKISEFNTKFRGFLTEKDNLKYIVSISGELKTFIEKYNEAVNQLNSLNSSLSSEKSKRNAFEKSNENNADYKSLSEYTSISSRIRGIENNVSGKSREISNLVQNIELCIARLKAIQFGLEPKTTVDVATAAPVPVITEVAPGEVVPGESTSSETVPVATTPGEDVAGVIPEVNTSDDLIFASLIANNPELKLLQEQIEVSKLYISQNMFINEETKNKVKNMTEQDLVNYYILHNYGKGNLSDEADDSYDSNIFLLAEFVYKKQSLIEKLKEESGAIPTLKETKVDSPYGLSAQTLLSTPVSGFNSLFRTNYEEPIERNIQTINLNGISLNAQLSTAQTVLRNMEGTNDPKQLIALDMAREAESRLRVQVEQNDKARIQQQQLLQKYKELNRNGGWFSSEGEIRAIKSELERTSDPAKTAELTSKLNTAIEKFNTENVSGIIPMNNVLDPVLTDSLSQNNSLVTNNVPAEVKETFVLSLLTESFYNSPQAETPISNILDANNNLVGYQVVDNRFTSGQQTYTLNIVPEGYTLNIGDKTFTYKKVN